LLDFRNPLLGATVEKNNNYIEGTMSINLRVWVLELCRYVRSSISCKKPTAPW